MGHILHDWGLEEKRQLIAKAHAALPKGGALIVCEAIIDDQRRQNTFGFEMIAVTCGPGSLVRVRTRLRSS